MGGVTAFLTSNDVEDDSDSDSDEMMDSSKPLDPVLCKVCECDSLFDQPKPLTLPWCSV